MRDIDEMERSLRNQEHDLNHAPDNSENPFDNLIKCLLLLIFLFFVIVYLLFSKPILLILAIIVIGLYIYKRNKLGALWNKGKIIKDVINKVTEIKNKNNYNESAEEIVNEFLVGVTPWNKDETIGNIRKKISDKSVDPIDERYIGLIKEVVYKKFDDHLIVASKIRLNGLIDSINSKLSNTSKDLFSNELQRIKSLANVLPEKNKEFKKSCMYFLDSNIRSLRYNTINDLNSKIEQHMTAIAGELDNLTSNLNTLESKADDMLRAMDKSLVEQNFGGNVIDYNNFNSEIGNELSAQINSLEQTIKTFEHEVIVKSC